MDDESDPGMPLPLELMDPDKPHGAGFPQGPFTPVGAARIWWDAVGDPVKHRDVLEQLTWHPSAWGDFRKPSRILAELSIMEHPIIPEERPDDLAYVKFIDIGGQDARGFDWAELTDVWLLTVVRSPDTGLWLVWGLSHNHVPPASEVFGS